MGLAMLGCDLFVTELPLGAVAENAGGEVGEEKGLDQGAEIHDTMEFPEWHRYLLFNGSDAGQLRWAVRRSRSESCRH